MNNIENLKDLIIYQSQNNANISVTSDFLSEDYDDENVNEVGSVAAFPLVMDIKNMREQNVETEFLSWTREHIDTIKVGDQEIINEVCGVLISKVD